MFFFILSAVIYSLPTSLPTPEIKALAKTVLDEPPSSIMTKNQEILNIAARKGYYEDQLKMEESKIARKAVNAQKSREVAANVKRSKELKTKIMMENLRKKQERADKVRLERITSKVDL